MLRLILFVLKSEYSENKNIFIVVAESAVQTLEGRKQAADVQIKTTSTLLAARAAIYSNVRSSVS